MAKRSQIIRYKFPHPRGGGYSAGGVGKLEDGRVTLSHGMLTRTNHLLGASHSAVPVELQITFNDEEHALRAIRNWAGFLGYTLVPDDEAKIEGPRRMLHKRPKAAVREH